MLFALHFDFAEGTTPITSDDMLVILDSGCTCAITFDKSDFIRPMHPVQDVELMGISSGLEVTGIGQVIWTFLDENQHRVQIPLTCLYVPEATTRLLPPQQLSERNEASTTNGSWIGYRGSALVFHEGNCIKFSYHEGSNLPVAKLAPGITKLKAFTNTIEQSSSNDSLRTDNLSPASRKLLQLHH
jgi:hypothetical protein